MEDIIEIIVMILFVLFAFTGNGKKKQNQQQKKQILPNPSVPENSGKAPLTAEQAAEVFEKTEEAEGKGEGSLQGQADILGETDHSDHLAVQEDDEGTDPCHPEGHAAASEEGTDPCHPGGLAASEEGTDPCYPDIHHDDEQTVESWNDAAEESDEQQMLRRIRDGIIVSEILNRHTIR